MNAPLDTIRSELAEVCGQVRDADIESCCRELTGAARIFVVGAGRSGFMASAFAMRLLHLGYVVHVVGEATCPAFAAGDTVVAVSGSGGTSGTVRAVREANRARATVIAVTTDSTSELAEAASTVLAIPAATKHRADREAPTVQPLSSLFDQTVHLVLDAVCLKLALRTGVDNTAANAAHVTTE